MVTLFTLTFALAGWKSTLGRLSDNSFLWHLRTGQWILDHAAVPHHDLFSFTAPGVRWVAQSWLAEVIYACLDRAVGPFGIRLLTAGTGALVAALAYRLAVRLAGDRLIAAGIALGAIAASFTLWAERPLFLGILAFMGLLWVVEVPGGRLGRRPLVSVPVLMWVWANLHGSFALGFVYLGLHLAGRWLDGAPPWLGRERALASASAVALAACLLNPYGPALLLFPIQLVSRGDVISRIVEWRSPDFRSLQGICFAGWLAVLVGCVTLGRHRLSRRDVLVAVPFTLLALWAQRNITIAPLVGLPVAARAVAVAVPRPEMVGRLNRPIGALLVAMGLLWTTQAATQPDFRFDPYPVRAMRFVDQQGLLGRHLLTDDGWAAYVIARYWPRQPVFIDDRYDMYPIPVIDDFFTLNHLDPGWAGVLDRRGIDVVVWNRKKPLTQVLDLDPGWRRIYEDDQAGVWVRR
jgi:hypothetical protein